MADRLYFLNHTLPAERVLEFLSCLDAIHNRILDITSDQLDVIRFAFLTVCEYVGYEDLSPLTLVRDRGFSPTSAFHITRGHRSRDGEMLAVDGIPPPLFAFFWSSDLGDFQVPKEEFDRVEGLIQKARGELKDNEDLMLALELDLLDLQKNRRDQTQRVQKNYAELPGMSAHWFDDPSVYDRLVENCIIPRTILSQFDALYAARFVNVIARTSRSFSLRLFFESFLRPFHFLVFSATHEETSSFGILLSKLLKIVKDRDEEEIAHNLLMEKVRLLLARRRLSALGNTISLLSALPKYFPVTPEHIEEIRGLVMQLKVPPESDVHLRLKRYQQRFADANKKATETVAAPAAPAPPTPPAEVKVMSKSRSEADLAPRPPPPPRRDPPARPPESRRPPARDPPRSSESRYDRPDSGRDWHDGPRSSPPDPRDRRRSHR
jgi:hypothetical protein